LKDVIAIVLGGGRGTRLYPLTLARAKPAVGFAGKYRLIDIPLSNCIHSGVDRVFVLTQFLSASLHRHIMQTYQFDSFRQGFIDILAAEQTPERSDWFQGTADAVRSTLGHITYYRSRQVLVLSGDHLYRMDYSKLLRYHRQRRANVTLCAHPVSRAEAPEMGLLAVGAEDRVQDFIEKPHAPEVLRRFRVDERMRDVLGMQPGDESYLASMGVYVFESEFLFRMLLEERHTDFGKEAIPSMVGHDRIVAYPFRDYWQDIGTIGSYYEASISLAQRQPPFALYDPRWPIFTRERTLPPTRVLDSEIRDSLLGEGSEIVGARISASVIGLRSMIREGSRLEEVVLLGADHYQDEEGHGGEPPPRAGLPSLGVGRRCLIQRAILDKNARIGDDVVIRGSPGLEDRREESYWVRDGIVVIPKGTVLPAGTRVGAG